MEVGWEQQRSEKVLKAYCEAGVHRLAVMDMGYVRWSRTILGFGPEHLQAWHCHQLRQERRQEHVFFWGGAGIHLGHMVLFCQEGSWGVGGLQAKPGSNTGSIAGTCTRRNRPPLLAPGLQAHGAQF